jgi:uncharacterized protein YllA (UPF0747 family)
MKAGDRVTIHPESARREAASATVEVLTASGYSISLRLEDNRPMLLSRAEDGRWVEVSTGRRFELELHRSA